MIDTETIALVLQKTAVFAPIVIGLVEVLKVSGVPTRWLPLSAVVLGIAFGIAFIASGSLGVLSGIALGLSANGLYEFTKRTFVG